MNALIVENLTKKYLMKVALDELSVTFEKGKIIALLGPNGSGKTTFMRIAAGLLQSSSGHVKLATDTPTTQKHLKQQIAFMPTESHLYEWMTIKEMIAFFNTFFENYDTQKAHDMVEQLTLNPNQKIATLSTGQRGRLKLALTLARDAQVYLIDEPLNGIDPISRDMILDLLTSNISPERCMIVSSHLVNEFERICDDIVFIKDGKLELQGNTDALRAEHNKSIHDLYKEVYKYA